ncbi:hypothetical protein ACLM5H_09220 [Fredinandcohnia humi]
MVSIHLGSINSFILDNVTYDIKHLEKFPQTIEYLGNKISIDTIKIGNPTEVIIRDENTEDREYEVFYFDFFSDNSQIPLMMNITGNDGVWIDKNGNKYYIRDYYPEATKKIHPPRYYQTDLTIELFNDLSEEQIIPTKMKINGYSTTKYIDEMVEISLEES